MSDRADHDPTLIRYLRQRRELGEREIFLERGTADEVLATLRSGGRGTRSPDAADPGAPSAADPADAFESFRAEVLACTRCQLAEGRTTVVFGEGDREADLMVVGEAPGREEDRTGRPFVGRAGRLLNRMLAAIGFDRPQVFICNVLKCRPPKNRDPLPDEVAACRPYLLRQIEMVRPKAIGALGRFAAQALLGTDQSLGRMRGTVHDLMDVPVIATYHPAALLRNQAWKRAAWEDLQLLRRVYDEAGGRDPEATGGTDTVTRGGADD